MPELTRFVRSFQKALRLEMETMRNQMGSFEVPLLHGRVLEPPAEDSSIRFRYVFSLAGPNEKLNAHLECTLRHEKSEYLVRVVAVSPDSIQLACGERIPLDGIGHLLVIYPWFLYEKLLSALAELSPNHHIDNGLRLFGRLPNAPLARIPLLDHSELNTSQQRAITLCCQLNPTFIWGPPGSGKTRTLGSLLAELLHQDKRILLTSTTNAAVDQALDQLAQNPMGHPFFERHQIVRLGQATANTQGTTLAEVSAALDQDNHDRLDDIEHRLMDLTAASKKAQEALNLLEQTLAESQLNLFAETAPTPHILPFLRSIFSTRRAAKLVSEPPDKLIPLIARRLQRLQRLLELYHLRSHAVRTSQRQREQQAFAKARLIFATLANVYLHPLMHDAHFDAVIIE